MTYTNTSVWQLVALAFVGLVLLGGVSMVGMAGAATTTDTANFTAVGNDTLSNQEFVVDNDTRSLYVDLDNSAYNATEPVNTTVYGIDADGNETQVQKVQISAASDSVESYEYANLNTSKYDSYRLLVEGNGSAVESAALDVGTVSKISGGGGLLGGSSIGGVPVLVLVGLVGGYVLFVRD
jgi:hypothetical protein